MQENPDDQVAIAQFQAVFGWTHLVAFARNFPVTANRGFV